MEHDITSSWIIYGWHWGGFGMCAQRDRVNLYRRHVGKYAKPYARAEESVQVQWSDHMTRLPLSLMCIHVVTAPCTDEYTLNLPDGICHTFEKHAWKVVESLERLWKQRHFSALLEKSPPHLILLLSSRSMVIKKSHNAAKTGIFMGAVHTTVVLHTHGSGLQHAFSSGARAQLIKQRRKKKNRHAWLSAKSCHRHETMASTYWSWHYAYTFSPILLAWILSAW